MTNIYKHPFLVVLLSLLGLCACKKWTKTEALILQKPGVKSEAYYENLKTYKKSDHPVAFGWFGNWSATGTSAAKYLIGLPDSMDMVSIWGGWSNLSPEKQADLKKVQTTKGTRAMICFILVGFDSGNGAGKQGLLLPGEKIEDVADTTFAIRHADALLDSINKYGYDGFDIDWEPNSGGYYSDYTNNRELFQVFVREMSKQLGPKSGTGKLLCIDGEVYDNSVSPVADCFDYFIAQSYESYLEASLQQQYSYIKDYKDMNTKKFILTVNYETPGSQGGGDFTSATLGNIEVSKLVGYAAWNPFEGRKGGIGGYHIENDFSAYPGRDYHFLRTAIQLQNPSAY